LGSQKNEQMDRQTNECLERWIDRHMNNVWKDGKRGRATDWQIRRRTNVQTDRQEERQIERQTDAYTNGKK